MMRISMARVGSALERLTVLVLKLPVLIWRYGVSPVMPMACRYQPTCSAYALEALGVHGPLKGLWLSLRRLIRCHPWGGFGYDPVPPRGAFSAFPEQASPSSGLPHCSCHGTPSCPTNEI